MMSDTIIQFMVFGPGLAALIAGLLFRFIGDRGAMLITTITVCSVGILALIQLFNFTFGGDHGGGDAHGAVEAAHAAGAHIAFSWNWISVGAFEADWAIRVDALSIVMTAVITSVSGLVHLYSWGYMADDPHRARFFSYLSLFTFAMLMLVTADNFIQLFFGWEGVGLASYLLIGFWHTKEAPNDAAIKAFVTNRVGDFGLALGIMAVFLIFGSVEFETVLGAIKTNAELVPLALAEAGQVRDIVLPFLGMNLPALEVIGVLLFIGAMGKSAQFFLHVWLPDAMEGPTPVSALIHAATMVTAGVYLVCLMSPIYEYAPVSASMIALVGAVTAIYAATVGMAQNDIKRVIAYSTCSQLGYMFFAAGVGAYEAAMFHLFTHAFFKALLFLGAGSVIHGNHHEQDMRRMGGVWRYQKFTYVAMLIGTVAIIGLGIPHVWGLSGFFSKDAIIESAFSASLAGVPFSAFAFWIGVTAALLTSFYSWRLIFMTFHGPRAEVDHHEDAHGHDDHHHGGDDPHESPLVMLVPLALLSVGAIFAGWIFYDSMFHHGEAFWGDAIYRAADNHVIHDIDKLKHDAQYTWVFWAPLVVTIIGFLIALFTYFFNRGFGKKIADGGGPLHSLFENKWFFDEIYNATLVKGFAWLGDTFWRGDKKFIDRLGADGMTGLVKWGSRRLSAMHTGYLYHYAFVIIGAALVFGAVMFWRSGGA